MKDFFSNIHNLTVQQFNCPAAPRFISRTVQQSNGPTVQQFNCPALSVCLAVWLPAVLMFSCPVVQLYLACHLHTVSQAVTCHFSKFILYKEQPPLCLNQIPSKCEQGVNVQNKNIQWGLCNKMLNITVSVNCFNLPQVMVTWCCQDHLSPSVQSH